MTDQPRRQSRTLSKEHRLALGPGIYGLLIEIRRDVTIPTGRLGAREYNRGWYVYIGSALKGISGRLQHHLRRRKRARWHVDYLLAHGELEAVVAAETHDRVECALARLLAERFDVIPRFGSSDCRCPGHLLRSPMRSALLEATIAASRSLGCRPQLIENPRRR
ncbi:MAG: GIY-YIG nuclease family protein [Chloroflexi bacterium]|nr:GIY-YIG nuclease family protein [Chloroflexota bacterium]